MTDSIKELLLYNKIEYPHFYADVHPLLVIRRLLFPDLLLNHAFHILQDKAPWIHLGLSPCFLAIHTPTALNEQKSNNLGLFIILRKPSDSTGSIFLEQESLVSTI